METSIRNGSIRSIMWKRDEYDGIDLGVRFAVKVLHAAGIETCQSCQGGAGHSYPEPSIDLPARGDDADGFGALAALQAYGLPVFAVHLVWSVRNGVPYEKLWRIVFSSTMEDRAAQWPGFIYGYMPVDDEGRPVSAAA